MASMKCIYIVEIGIYIQLTLEIHQKTLTSNYKNVPFLQQGPIIFWDIRSKNIKQF